MAIREELYTAGVMANAHTAVVRTFGAAAGQACRQYDGHEIATRATPYVLGMFSDSGDEVSHYVADFGFPTAEHRKEFMAEMIKHAAKIDPKDGKVIVMAGNVTALALALSVARAETPSDRGQISSAQANSSGQKRKLLEHNS